MGIEPETFIFYFYESICFRFDLHFGRFFEPFKWLFFDNNKLFFFSKSYGQITGLSKKILWNNLLPTLLCVHTHLVDRICLVEKMIQINPNFALVDRINKNMNSYLANLKIYTGRSSDMFELPVTKNQTEILSGFRMYPI